MTPTSTIAGLLTGLLDGLVVAAIVLAVVLLTARRRRPAPVRRTVRPGDTRPPRNRTPEGELPRAD